MIVGLAPDASCEDRSLGCTVGTSAASTTASVTTIVTKSSFTSSIYRNPATGFHACEHFAHYNAGISRVLIEIQFMGTRHNMSRLSRFAFLICSLPIVAAAAPPDGAAISQARTAMAQLPLRFEA